MGGYEKQRKREKDWEDMKNRETEREGEDVRNKETEKRIGKI